MKKSTLVQTLTAAAITALLVSCGGGGGGGDGHCFPIGSNCSGSGLPGGGGDDGSGDGNNGGETPVAQPKLEAYALNAAGTPTKRLSTSENAELRITLLDAQGNPVTDAPVTVTTDGNSVVAPASTLTDASGRATLSLKAASREYAGLSEITVNSKVGEQEVTVTESILFTNQAAEEVDPLELAKSIELASVEPADQSIVIKGAGASGRSETAAVRFRIVDKDGAPVKDVPVTFGVNPAGVVDLNIASAKTDSDGYVLTTVTSKENPGTVIVTAEVAGTTLKSQSDSLTVTTGVAIQAGVDFTAAKYNLDGMFSGDTTSLTVRLRDANGNPVADGVAAVMTTDLGAVGSSSRGGCTTQNGACSVDFVVQEPRGNGLATVIASVNTNSTNLSKSLQVNMAKLGSPTNPVIAPQSFSIGASCKAKGTITLTDDNGRSLAAGTTVTAYPMQNNEFGATVERGSPVLDSMNFMPTTATLAFDAGSAGCDADNPSANTGNATEVVRVEITAPASKLTVVRDITINYRVAP